MKNADSIGLKTDLSNVVLEGDCLEVLKALPSNHFHALVTDPPASIKFMGREWDDDKGGAIHWINWLSEVLHEAMRTLKPGAVGAVWSLPRVCGYTQLAIEMAGFRIWDCVAHIQGSGFPKAQDLSRLIDQELGVADEREVVGNYDTRSLHDNCCRNSDGKGAGAFSQDIGFNETGKRQCTITAPASPEAAQWDGWKTPALKPSNELWFCIQKPISEGNIARNILKHGVGGLNIEAARIGITQSDYERQKAKQHKATMGQQSKVHNYGQDRNYEPSTVGRYPSNTILSCAPECTAEAHADHCPVSIMGAQSGESVSSGGGMKNGDKYGGGYSPPGEKNIGHGDTGTAARYFLQLPHDPDTFIYQPKASKRDRTCNGQVQNVHPTVKSTPLMEYFCKLMCPPGGIVLDPFGGSGSTALGAIKAGMRYCLIEQDPEYVAIAKQRINAVSIVPPFEKVKEVRSPQQSKHQQLSLL